MAKQLQAGGQRAGRAGKGTSHLHARRQRAVHASRHLIIKCMPLSTADRGTPQQMQDTACRCDRPEGSKAALASKPASFSAPPRRSTLFRHAAAHTQAPPALPLLRGAVAAVHCALQLLPPAPHTLRQLQMLLTQLARCQQLRGGTYGVGGPTALSVGGLGGTGSSASHDPAATLQNGHATALQNCGTAQASTHPACCTRLIPRPLKVVSSGARGIGWQIIHRLAPGSQGVGHSRLLLLAERLGGPRQQELRAPPLLGCRRGWGWERVCRWAVGAEGGLGGLAVHEERTYHASAAASSCHKGYTSNASSRGFARTLWVGVNQACLQRLPEDWVGLMLVPQPMEPGLQQSQKTRQHSTKQEGSKGAVGLTAEPQPAPGQRAHRA